MKRWIRNVQDKQRLIAYLQRQTEPMTITIEKGIHDKRSNDQNRLQRLWLNELAEQGDMTAEEYRAYCKLHFGVPILRNANEQFRTAYDDKVKPFPYEQKLAFMAEPFDFPVTRLMTVKQHKQFLDAIYVHFTGLGFVLTNPDDLGWSEYE